MQAGQPQHSGAVDNERPAYVEFEEREFEDRAMTIANGAYTTKMVPVAIITRPGSRDSLEKVAEEWLKEMKEKSRQGMIPPTWYPAYQAKYSEWKSGVSTEGIDGTPIATWPLCGKALAKAFINAGIRSVEDLAQVADQDLQNVGTGALGMKQKAKFWLEQASGPGKTTERIASLENKLTELVDLVRQQADTIKAKDAQITAMVQNSVPVKTAQF